MRADRPVRNKIKPKNEDFYYFNLNERMPPMTIVSPKSIQPSPKPIQPSPKITQKSPRVLKNNEKVINWMNQTSKITKKSKISTEKKVLPKQGMFLCY